MADGEDRNGTGDWDSPKRQRGSRKSLNATAGKDVGKLSISDVLHSSILTVKVWETLFDLFQLHYATMLPFLHPTTFLAQIRQLHSQNGQLDPRTNGNGSHSQSPAPRGEASPVILLGILTLTARFHTQLIQYHSPSSPSNPSNPLAASEYYASFLRARLTAGDSTSFTSPDISRVQALLMLGLHEWGMCRGKNAWIYVGMAIRMAQVMELSCEVEPACHPSRRASIHSNLEKDQNSDDVIDQEAKRRTYWSCFMLDRCLSGGKYRPRMIKVDDLGIQLPSDNAFAFGERVRTSKLVEGNGNRRIFDPRGMPIPSLRQSNGLSEDLKLRANGSDKPWSSSSHRSDGAESGIDRWEVGAEECVMSRLIRVMRIWGSVSKWSCAGGKRADQYAPWHSESRFTRLKDLLVEFQDALPRNLQYSPRNTDTHIMYKNTLAPYALMHIVYFLSVIVLHRSYVQFLPLDEPTFPPDKYNTPESYYRDGAGELFRSARQMLELVKTCHDRGVLMETPLVGFAVYNAAFIGVYATHFNHMDEAGFISSKPNSTDILPGFGCQGQVEVRKALEIIGQMRSRLPMAIGWFRTIHRSHTYFSKVQKDYKRATRKIEMMSENGIQVNGRSASFASQHDELRLLDKVLMELGSPEDHAQEVNGFVEQGVPPLNGVHVVAEHGPTSDTASNPVRSEPGDQADALGQTDGAAKRESWVPVNTPNHAILPPSRDGAEKTELPRLSEWANAPPPPPSYNLPSIHHHSLPPTTSSTSPNAPPPLPSPGIYTSGPPSSLTPYASAPPPRLQPLQPSPTSLPPPPPPYSQSLPSLNAAAQQNFPLPQPISSAPLHHHLLTPPGGPRLSPLPPDLGTAHPTWMGCLGGDDVLMFVEGEGYERWNGILGKHGSAVSGWLSMVWEGYGQ